MPALPMDEAELTPTGRRRVGGDVEPVSALTAAPRAWCTPRR